MRDALTYMHGSIRPSPPSMPAPSHITLTYLLEDSHDLLLVMLGRFSTQKRTSSPSTYGATFEQRRMNDETDRYKNVDRHRCGCTSSMEKEYCVWFSLVEPCLTGAGTVDSTDSFCDAVSRGCGCARRADTHSTHVTTAPDSFCVRMWTHSSSAKPRDLDRRQDLHTADTAMCEMR